MGDFSSKGALHEEEFKPHAHHDKYTPDFVKIISDQPLMATELFKVTRIRKRIFINLHDTYCLKFWYCKLQMF